MSFFRPLGVPQLKGCDLCGHRECESCCDVCNDPKCPNNQGCPECRKPKERIAC